MSKIVKYIAAGLSIAIVSILCIGSAFAKERSGSQNGSIEIRVNVAPYHVYLDGRYLALSNEDTYTMTDVTEGEHTITVTKQEYVAETRVVDVSGGDENVVEIQMLEAGPTHYMENGRFSFGFSIPDDDFTTLDPLPDNGDGFSGTTSSESGDWMMDFAVSGSNWLEQEDQGEPDGTATVVLANGELAYVPFYQDTEVSDEIADSRITYSIINPDAFDGEALITVNINLRIFEGLMDEEDVPVFCNRWLTGNLKLLNPQS